MYHAVRVCDYRMRFKYLQQFIAKEKLASS